MTTRLAGVFALALVVASCNGIQYPSAPTGAAPAAAATTINLVASPAQLPEGGGTSTINIEVLAGVTGVADARVEVAASAGTLSASEVATDKTGHARIEWRGTRTGTVTARVGDVASTTTIRVPEAAIVNPPATPPPPGPAPPPHPGPSAGELTVRLEMSEAFAGEPVSFNATVSGNGVPFALASLEWDLNADGQPDRSGNPATWTYATAGPQTVDVVATATDGRRGEAGWRFTVLPADFYTVSLAASPSSANTGATITLTANAVSRTGTLPAGLMFEWDYDGDGTTDATTVAATTTTSYSTAGSRTVTVTAAAGDGRRVSASTTVTITIPALAVSLAASPSSVAVGTSTTLTATVSNLQDGETIATYSWDFNNDGTVDATTTTPTRATTYTTAGTKTARVSITSSNGRTAAATVTIVVTGS